MKKVIFFILGAAITYIVVNFAIQNISTEYAIFIEAGAALFGGLIGSSLAKKSHSEEQKTSSLGRTIIWILALAIIVVAVVIFFGLNS